LVPRVAKYVSEQQERTKLYTTSNWSDAECFVCDVTLIAKPTNVTTVDLKLMKDTSTRGQVGRP
jgi:hypothetical protein